MEHPSEPVAGHRAPAARHSGAIAGKRTEMTSPCRAIARERDRIARDSGTMAGERLEIGHDSEAIARARAEIGRDSSAMAGGCAEIAPHSEVIGRQRAEIAPNSEETAGRRGEIGPNSEPIARGRRRDWAQFRDDRGRMQRDCGRFGQSRGERDEIAAIRIEATGVRALRGGERAQIRHHAEAIAAERADTGRSSPVIAARCIEDIVVRHPAVFARGPSARKGHPAQSTAATAVRRLIRRYDGRRERRAVSRSCAGRSQICGCQGAGRP